MSKKSFYSLRAIKASSKKQAIKKTEDGDFNENDPLCDKILSRSELRDATFPNGFMNWQETHFMIVSEINRHIDEGIAESKAVFVLEFGGTGAVWTLACELTDKFEEKYKGTDWDGEYLDAIDAFLNEELFENRDNIRI